MTQAALVSRLIAAISIAVVVVGAGAALYIFRYQAAARSVAPLSPAPASAPPQSAGLSTARKYVGVFERGVPATYRPVARFAAVAGERPDIAVYYSGWDDPFQARFAEAAAAQGAVAFVQMEPRGHTMASIAAGDSDRYLRSYARSVRAYGGQVIISFAPEPDGPWYEWGWGHTPPFQWVHAWRHVVDVFRQQGARNVTWLWDMNRVGRATGPIRDYWPGRRYVTWVGIDGYYIYPSDTFGTVFGKTLAQVRAFTRAPVLISEVGIGPVSGQAAKIPGLFAGIIRHHLLGLVWFDTSQHAGIWHQDWRLEGKARAVAAFRAGVNRLTSG